MKAVFVTGKGGVGKTRTAWLLSQKFPDAELIEYTKGLEEVGKRSCFRERKILHFTRKDLAEDLLIRTLKFKPVATMLSRSQTFQSLLQLAPNLYELLLLDRWFEVAKEKPVIVDAPSTGHFIALFDSLQTALELFDGGSLRKIAESLHQRFLKGNDIEIVIVATPEHSALEEMKVIQEDFSRKYPGVSILRYLNRLHEAPSVTDDLSEELKTLALERPRREAARIKGTDFDEMIREGDISL